MKWREGITRGAMLGMESIWIYGVVAVSVALWTRGGEPSFFGVVAIVVASFTIARVLQNTEMSVGLIRVWGLSLSLLVFYAIVRLDFFGNLRLWDFSWTDELFSSTADTVQQQAAASVGIPLLWAFWMRGVLRGQQFVGFDSVVGSFGFGLLIIIGVEVLQGAGDTPAAVRALAVPYVAIGLLAMALAHANRSQDQFNKSFDSSWLIGVGGAVLLLGAIASLFAVFDFATASSAVQATTHTVGLAVSQVFVWLVWPFIKGIELLVHLVAPLFHVFFGEQGEPPDQTRLQPQEEVAANQGGNPLPAWVQLLIRTSVGITLIAILLFLMAMTFSRFRRRNRASEVKESTYQEGRLAADLGDMLSNLLNRFRPSFHLGSDDMEPVRRLYFQMLADGSKQGIDRAKGETPLELSPRLETVLMPDLPPRITGVFDAARYGGLPTPPDELSRLRTELEQSRG